MESRRSGERFSERETEQALAYSESVFSDGGNYNAGISMESKTQSESRNSSREKSVAYSNGGVETNGRKCSIPTQQSDGGRIGQAGGGTDDRERCFRSSGKGSEDDMAYSGGEGLEGFGIRTIGTEQKESLPTRSSCIVRAINKSDFWEVEPQLGRVADGIPNRVDRLKQLGNSLVPQIPELIGYAILQKEQLK